MDTCPKYNRAMVPSYSSLAGLEELQVWSYNITTDPVTRTIYEDGFSRAFWLPFRSHHYIDKENSICDLHLPHIELALLRLIRLVCYN